MAVHLYGLAVNLAGVRLDRDNLLAPFRLSHGITSKWIRANRNESAALEGTAPPRRRQRASPVRARGTRRGRHAKVYRPVVAV
jgi:hypothetical protein